LGKRINFECSIFSWNRMKKTWFLL
jgi:hypothetical protein